MPRGKLKGSIPWNKGLTKETDSRVAKNALSVSLSTKGKKKTYKKSEETKEKIRRNAIKNRLGGNKNHAAFGWYESPSAGRVWLESSYEHAVAVELDRYKVRWVRPQPLSYIREGRHHYYYPDFFLIDYNVYLDPKNNYLIEKDREKIKLVRQQHDIKLLILTREELKWETIRLKSSAGDDTTLTKWQM